MPAYEQTTNGTQLAGGFATTGTATNTYASGGVIIPAYEPYGENQNQIAAASYAVSHTIFPCDGLSGTFKIAAVSVRFGTASTSGTLQVEVAGAAVAIGSGVNQLTAPISLSGAANTNTAGVVIASPTVINSASAVNLIFAGTVTNLANASVTVVLQRLS